MIKTLPEAIEYAAKELPEGWTIRLEAMSGYGGIVLEDPSLNEKDFDDRDHSLAQRVCAAVEYAKANQVG